LCEKAALKHAMFLWRDCACPAKGGGAKKVSAKLSHTSAGLAFLVEPAPDQAQKAPYNPSNRSALPQAMLHQEHPS
jgi:hypothetical protein